MQEIALVFGLLLAVYGAAELVRRVVAWLLPPAGYWVIPLCGEREDTEYLIRAARLRSDGVRPVVVDCGLAPPFAAPAQEVCQRMRVPFFTEKEWSELSKIALQDTQTGV